MPHNLFFKTIKTIGMLSVLLQFSCLAKEKESYSDNIDNVIVGEVLETPTRQKLSENSSLLSRHKTEQETIIWLNNYFETLKKYNFPIDERELDLCSNEMTFIPEIIFTLPSLGKLFFMSNKLTTINEKISNLKNLTTLHLTNNAIVALPSAFSNLPNLTELCLAQNQLEDLPNSFGKLTKLKALDLSSNKLTILPLTFGYLRHLTELNLLNNPLRLPTSLPIGKFIKFWFADLLPQNGLEAVLIHHHNAENKALEIFLLFLSKEGSTIDHLPRDILYYITMYFIQLTLTTESLEQKGNKNEIKELR